MRTEKLTIFWRGFSLGQYYGKHKGRKVFLCVLGTGIECKTQWLGVPCDDCQNEVISFLNPFWTQHSCLCLCLLPPETPARQPWQPQDNCWPRYNFIESSLKIFFLLHTLPEGFIPYLGSKFPWCRSWYQANAATAVQALSRGPSSSHLDSKAQSWGMKKHFGFCGQVILCWNDRRGWLAVLSMATLLWSCTIVLGARLRL